MPLQSRWPLFEVSASTWRPSTSSAIAKYSSSSTQKSRLKRRFRSAASFSSRSAKAGSFQTRRARRAAAHLRVVGVALELAGRAREARQRAVAVGDRVPGVLPALVLEPGLLVAALVRDVAVALEVRVLVDPVQRRARLVLEVAHELRVAGPALVLVEQHDVQRGRVDAAVVGRVRPLLEGRHLAVAHLVEDPARVLVAEVVDPRALALAERQQRRLRELRRERQRLQAREDAVAAEHGHEPRQARGGQRAARHRAGREAQRGEVDEAAVVGVPAASRSRTRGAGARWSHLSRPARHVRAGALGAASIGPRPQAANAALTSRSVFHWPCARDLHLERQSRRVDLRRLRRGDQRLARERLARVAEHEPCRARSGGGSVPFFFSASLTSNRSAKSLAASRRTSSETGLSSWFRIVSSSWKPSATVALADHRELRVDVDGARSRDEEEARLEVLQVVGREGVQPLAVDREHPLREEAGVEREEPGRVDGRGVDVAVPVADDERVPLEDLDELAAHRIFLA